MFRSQLDQRRPPRHCPHFVAVETFVNLNGWLPVETRSYTSLLDVPFVMPVFLPDDIESYAVMHSLPICRMENGAFVPRYAAYMLTYYSTTPSALWYRREHDPAVAEAYVQDPEYEGAKLNSCFDAQENPEWLKLRLWVERGKLKWLDPSSPDLRLRQGPPEAFPYADIKGYQDYFIVDKGKLIR